MRTNVDYRPLEEHLSQAAEKELALSYSEIERILGQPLPPSARGEHIRQFWANTTTHSQARSWLRAGRRAKVDVRAKRVLFVREGGAPAPEEPDAITIRRSSLAASTLRMLEDLAEASGAELGAAAGELLNRAALKRRSEILDWFAENTTPSKTTSAELVRAARDGR